MGEEHLCYSVSPLNLRFFKIVYIHIIPVLGFLDLILNPKTAGQNLLARALAYADQG